MGDGKPGTGKTTLIQMLGGLLHDYCQIAGYPFRYENLSSESIDSYQGKSAQNAKAFIRNVMDPHVIGFGTIDDIDQIAGRRGDRQSSAGQQEITAVLMESFAGANTVVRGNCTFGMFSNYPENVDDALRQRAGARFLVDGPRSAADYIDILHLLLGKNHDIAARQARPLRRPGDPPRGGGLLRAARPPQEASWRRSSSGRQGEVGALDTIAKLGQLSEGDPGRRRALHRARGQEHHRRGQGPRHGLRAARRMDGGPGALPAQGLRHQAGDDRRADEPDHRRDGPAGDQPLRRLRVPLRRRTDEAAVDGMVRDLRLQAEAKRRSSPVQGEGQARAHAPADREQPDLRQPLRGRAPDAAGPLQPGAASCSTAGGRNSNASASTRPASRRRWPRASTIRTISTPRLQPQFILLTLEQADLPLLGRHLHLSRAILRSFIDDNREALFALTARDAVFGELENSVYRSKTLGDLTSIKHIRVEVRTPNRLITKAQRLSARSTPSRRATTPGPTTRRCSEIIELAEAVGDVRRQPVIPDRIDYEQGNFFTTHLGGLYVFNSARKPTLIYCSPDQQGSGVYEDQTLGFRHIPLSDRAAIARFFKEGDLVEPLSGLKHLDPEELLREKLEFVAIDHASRNDAPAEIWDFEPMALRRYLYRSVDELPAELHDLQGALRALEQDESGGRLEPEAPGFFYLLRSARHKDRDLVNHLLARLTPLDFRQLFICNKDLFYELYETWNDRKRGYVAEYLARHYQGRAAEVWRHLYGRTQGAEGPWGERATGKHSFIPEAG